MLVLVFLLSNMLLLKQHLDAAAETGTAIDRKQLSRGGSGGRVGCCCKCFFYCSSSIFRRVCGRHCTCKVLVQNCHYVATIAATNAAETTPR